MIPINDGGEEISDSDRESSGLGGLKGVLVPRIREPYDISTSSKKNPKLDKRFYESKCYNKLRITGVDDFGSAYADIRKVLDLRDLPGKRPHDKKQ